MTDTSTDLKKIRKDFPLLHRKMNGKPLVYLDNAATTQKPMCVIDRLSKFYKEEYATVHRGVYALSHESTVECDQVRVRIAAFLNANEHAEIIFVRGATEAINLVASSFGDLCQPGDEILISEVEHHANLVPWQELCKRKQMRLVASPVNDKGEIIIEEFEKRITDKTCLVAVAHISNVLGTVNPIQELIQLAHAKGAKVLIDGAQGAPHVRVDVQALGCDFYCFSGHKIYGPSGIGVLYGKRDLLERMHPYQFGGDMIESVTLEKTEYASLPAKFEAGTPAIAQIVGLGAAIDYLDSVGWTLISKIEQDLLTHATRVLKGIPGLKIFGEARHKASLISFVLDDIHSHDVGTILDQEGIAIRAGHHCSQPTMQRYGISGTARASFAFYNTRDEINQLAESLERVREVMG